MRTYW